MVMLLTRWQKVMGPLIENLLEFGYTDKNLAALPVSRILPLHFTKFGNNIYSVRLANSTRDPRNARQILYTGEDHVRNVVQ